jgi:transcriptional regulator with XRE-family HTH domain
MINLRKLKARRVFYGLKQSEIEEESKVYSYDKKERGEVNISLEDSLKLAKALCITLKEYNEIFLGGALNDNKTTD